MLLYNSDTYLKQKICVVRTEECFTNNIVLNIFLIARYNLQKYRYTRVSRWDTRAKY